MSIQTERIYDNRYTDTAGFWGTPKRHNGSFFAASKMGILYFVQNIVGDFCIYLSQKS
jgi:hypothetical protein